MPLKPSQIRGYKTSESCSMFKPDGIWLCHDPNDARAQVMVLNSRSDDARSSKPSHLTLAPLGSNQGAQAGVREGIPPLSATCCRQRGCVWDTAAI